uniref:uncharacterized protein LOC122597833 n=1 Tax=Erigeron canadensis TaxID=72917 RepID=UPI001CB8E524|nr:uncharacterized protein LOC122597833 [Erigeron canadensis]
MEALIDQFTFLSDQALNDKNFDPSTIEELMRLFELDSYNAWAAMELEYETEVAEAENSLQEAEDYLNSAMEDAMEEFRKFEEEMELEATKQLQGLLAIGESARRLGKSMEKAANYASNKYVEAALNAATASMKSAMKSVSNKSKKVHPS